ncbi:transcriptional regulator GlxA family with amidase domain [Sphingomonas zeicaulis]|uniref:DJ-1/PfpI family protein n=1 Tax=Sphingomonas zeicaulis TaxID=1632740 RepID=UPI003D249EB9
MSSAFTRRAVIRIGSVAALLPLWAQRDAEAADGARDLASAQTKGDAEAMTDDEASRGSKSRLIGIVLFDDFETLDVFGPVQMWGRLPEHRLLFISPNGGAVTSAQGTVVNVGSSFGSAPQLDILMVPGGMGTRPLVKDAALLDFVRRQDRATRWTVSVCTGAAILARAGVLDGRQATTNKLAFDWVSSQSDKVRWRRKARWVFDGKYATSSGVSAGTDMALALVEKLYGRKAAEHAAMIAEYQWHDDPDNDPFASGQ